MALLSRFSHWMRLADRPFRERAGTFLHRMPAIHLPQEKNTMNIRILPWAFATLLAAGPVLAQGGPSDAQIAHIVVTANQVDIDAGKLAEKKGSTADVKAFGKQM